MLKERTSMMSFNFIKPLLISKNYLKIFTFEKNQDDKKSQSKITNEKLLFSTLNKKHDISFENN